MSFYDFSPVTPDPISAGDTDGRAVSFLYELNNPADPTGDTVTSVVGISITRQDGTAITSTDLALTGASHPTTIDASGLIVGIWFTAPPNCVPAGAPQVDYAVTMTVNTAQGRVLDRTLYLSVLALMG